MKMLFLIDGDNNIGTGLRGIEMLSEKDLVLIFYKKGLPLARIKAQCAGSSAEIQYIESVRGGKNSIDFQIITELGVRVGRGEADYAYIISQDKGYEASLSALRARYADTFCEVELRPAIEDCLKLTFLLKAKTRQELCDALAQEYGAAHGGLLYSHLKQLFAAAEIKKEAAPAGKPAPAVPSVLAPPAPAVTPAAATPAAVTSVKPTRRRSSRGGRRKKPAAETSAATVSVETIK